MRQSESPARTVYHPAPAIRRPAPLQAAFATRRNVGRAAGGGGGGAAASFADAGDLVSAAATGAGTASASVFFAGDADEGSGDLFTGAPETSLLADATGCDAGGVTGAAFNAGGCASTASFFAGPASAGARDATLDPGGGGVLAGAFGSAVALPSKDRLCSDFLTGVSPAFTAALLLAASVFAGGLAVPAPASLPSSPACFAGGDVGADAGAVADVTTLAVSAGLAATGLRPSPRFAASDTGSHGCTGVRSPASMRIRLWNSRPELRSHPIGPASSARLSAFAGVLDVSACASLCFCWNTLNSFEAASASASASARTRSSALVGAAAEPICANPTTPSAAAPATIERATSLRIHHPFPPKSRGKRAASSSSREMLQEPLSRRP